MKFTEILTDHSARDGDRTAAKPQSRNAMERMGLEPTTPGLQSRCSPN